MSEYSLQRSRKHAVFNRIDDASFRSECISVASTGMSRRGVADTVGVPIGTLLGWIERGMAYPEVEPYGSFSAQYRRAERGLERAAAGTVAMTVQMLFELTAKAMKGDLVAQIAILKNPQVRELLNLLESRFPRDWGQSKHREPEATFDAQHWLDAHAREREQLKALFTDPPELIRLAMEDAGCWPPRKRKAEDETARVEGL